MIITTRRVTRLGKLRPTWRRATLKYDLPIALASHCRRRCAPSALQGVSRTAEKKTIDTVRKALESAPERKFKETVEVAINLRDVDLSVPKNRIDDEVVLPKGRGRKIRVCVFGSGEMAVKARNAADLIIQPQEIESYAGDKTKARALAKGFDFFIAEAPLMPVIGKRLGVVLGPRGKMPRPVPPGSDPTPQINSMRSTVKVRSRDKRTFHAAIGTRDMTAEDIADNLDFLMRRVLGKLERGRFNIQSAYVKTTMGPAVKYL